MCMKKTIKKGVFKPKTNKTILIGSSPVAHFNNSRMLDTYQAFGCTKILFCYLNTQLQNNGSTRAWRHCSAHMSGVANQRVRFFFSHFQFFLFFFAGNDSFRLCFFFSSSFFLLKQIDLKKFKLRFEIFSTQI